MINFLKDFICNTVIICAFGFNGILMERWFAANENFWIIFLKSIPLFIVGSIAVEIYASHRDKWRN